MNSAADAFTHASRDATPRNSSGRFQRSLAATSTLTLLLLFHALVLTLLPRACLAWGPLGHRVIAALAEQQLSAPAQLAIQQLLAVSADSSLADISNWADEVRDDPAQRELSRATSKMHYINFADAQCHYDPARICAGGQCVVAAIETYRAILGDRTRPDVERAQALRFLVHFVGDAHQPLHAGYRPDRGGNDYQVRFNDKGSNLHSFWDSKVLGSRRLDWNDYALRLRRKETTVEIGDPRAWAEESCRITRDHGIYPGSRMIEPIYLEHMRPIAEQQVRRASTRLAALLNQTLE